MSIALLAGGMMLSMLAFSASAATVVNIDHPISRVIVNTCNGDVVTFSGTVHIALRETINGNIAHVGMHINYADVQGTAADGTKYVLNATGNAEDTFSLNNLGSGEGTFVNHVNMISQGSAPNRDGRILLHITVNANGDVTATMLEISVNCQG